MPSGVPKAEPRDLAVLGGVPLFARPKSIGNLVKPDFGRFLEYSRTFFAEGQYTNNGPCCRELEQRLADFHEVPYCIAFSSAFWGLSLAIRCLALPGKTEAVMPSLTYRRMGEIAASAGLIPRFCDVDPETLAQTAATVEPCINDDTALLIGAHPTVNCCDVAGLDATSRRHGIPLLFDSVESVYETYRGRRIGGFGSAEGFSIHSTKLVNGFEGGYITTADEELAQRLRHLRGFGFREQDDVVEAGFNAKLNEIHGAMALASLDDVEDQVERNRRRYHAYVSGLADIPGIAIRAFDESEKTSYKNIVVELTDEWPLTRSQTIDVLHAEGALARPYYWPALHTKETGFETRSGPLPVTEVLCEKFVLLPCGHQVGFDDVSAICTVLALAAEGSAMLENSAT